MTRQGRNDHLRRRIAYEAARLMADEGLVDHEHALRKAAARLGVKDRRGWPDPGEVQMALLEQQRLFHPEQARQLRDLRTHALQAMQALSRFQPRLVGPVLEGSADAASRVLLHLFADTPEEVVHALLEQGIPWREMQRALRFADGVSKTFPSLRFVAGGVPVELLVLSPRELRNPPLNPITERPDRGAGIRQLQSLLDAESASPDYRLDIGT